MISRSLGPRLILPVIFMIIFRQYCEQKTKLIISMEKSEQALKRRIKKRIRWSVLLERISDTHFCRMFRMTPECFRLLCCRITASIGESNFKSEAYIDAFLIREGIVHDRLSIIARAHIASSGGFISGKVKTGITLRMLAGGSALDIAILFHVQKIFLSVLNDWVICSNLGNIYVESYLKNAEAMKKVAIGFSRRSDGVLRDAIGAFNCWLMRIT